MEKPTYDKKCHETSIFEKQAKRKAFKIFITKLIQEIPDYKIDNFIKEYEENK